MPRGQGSVNVEVHLLGLVVVVREAAEYGQARVFVKHCGFCGCVLGCIVLNKVKMPFGPPIGTNAPLGMASLVDWLARALRCTGRGNASGRSPRCGGRPFGCERIPEVNGPQPSRARLAGSSWSGPCAPTKGGTPTQVVRGLRCDACGTAPTPEHFKVPLKLAASRHRRQTLLKHRQTGAGWVASNLQIHQNPPI